MSAQPRYVLTASIISGRSSRWPWGWISLAAVLASIGITFLDIPHAFSALTWLGAYALGHWNHQQMRRDDIARIHIKKLPRTTTPGENK